MPRLSRHPEGSVIQVKTQIWLLIMLAAAPDSAYFTFYTQVLNKNLEHELRLL